MCIKIFGSIGLSSLTGVKVFWSLKGLKGIERSKGSKGNAPTVVTGPKH